MAQEAVGLAASVYSGLSQFWARGDSITESLMEDVISDLSPYKLEITHGMTMSKNAFRRLVGDINQNGIQESIKYVEYEGEAYIVDGNHRVAAARQLGISEIPVEKVELPYAGYNSPNDLNYFNPKF
jgi:hypothetical protein